ncbi:MAG TPA: adenylate/guanylate cyclase domain-containing protein, partial [Rhodothermales bacterium]|nr:adenylate/guanylate cyclase domain-containing protein [Rhodothermales bacterium]
GNLEAFVIFVDINGFTMMVRRSGGNLIAQFVRDTLFGAIEGIEAEGGEVFNFAGDAVVGLLPTAESVLAACFRIAKDLNKVCEHISQTQSESDTNQQWNFAPGGPSLKIAVEYGRLDVSTMSTRMLGSHRHIVGDPINIASRISSAGAGNRCLVGAKAAEAGLSQYGLDGPYTIEGKPGEGDYVYYKLDLADAWLSGEDDGEGLSYLT